MEIITVICLIVIIVLLVQDKIVLLVSRQNKRKLPSEKHSPGIEDIMGKPKLNHSRLENISKDPGKRNTEMHHNSQLEGSFDDINIAIIEEGWEKGVRIVPDFEEEEEEWQNDRGFYEGSGFAMGVTFEELITVDVMLQHGAADTSMKFQAAHIAQKLDGTELLSLLENSIGNASQKIAELLDNSINERIGYGSPIVTPNNTKKFDIQDFI